MARKQAAYGNYKKIKRALLKGGLVVAPRRYGKTRALIEILHEDPTAVVITPHVEMGRYLSTMYFSKYKITDQHERDRILFRIFHTEQPQIKNTRVGDRPRFLRDKTIYVDELLYSGYVGEFAGAVSSAPFLVTLVKPSAREKRFLRKEAKRLPPDQANAEFLLY